MFDILNFCVFLLFSEIMFSQIKPTSSLHKLSAKVTLAAYSHAKLGGLFKQIICEPNLCQFIQNSVKHHVQCPDKRIFFKFSIVNQVKTDKKRRVASFPDYKGFIYESTCVVSTILIVGNCLNFINEFILSSSSVE